MVEASGSGTLQILLGLTERLAADGHAVALAYGSRPETPNELADSFSPGVTAVALPWRSRTVSAQLRAARALRRLVRSWRPDIVHLHSFFAGFVGTLAVPRGTVCLYTPHGFSFGRPGPAARVAYRAAQRLIARRCVIGAVSEAEADLARRMLGARRVHVVPNGIPELDTGSLPAVRRTGGALSVVGLGRLAAERRPAEAARILASVADVARVEWIGAAARGEDAPLRAAGVPMTGWLPRAEGLRRLAEATAYLHWSASDGLSVAILEALAHDVVVVASDIDANREVLGDAQVRRDPLDAATLLREVLLDPRRRSELLIAQQAARSRYSADAMAAGWLAVYGKLHSDGRPDRRTTPKIGAPWS